MNAKKIMTVVRTAILMALMSASVTCVAADVTATAVTAQQRHPWNGKVDITVTFTGTSNDVVNAVCNFVATNSSTHTALNVAHMTVIDGAIGSGITWQRQFVWDAVSDVGAVKIEDVTLAVEVLLGGVQLWENGPYWAECNVGATKPEEYGYYFWWGDTVGYSANTNNATWKDYWDGVKWTSITGILMDNSPFSSSTCSTFYKHPSQLQTAGYIDSTGNLVAAHDAATVYLGVPWRMPMDTEIDALISNCETTWTTHNGVLGRLVSGKGAYASKSIFLPAAGYGNNSTLCCPDGSCGNYWSSTPLPTSSENARGLYFDTGHCFGGSENSRYYGQSVRPLRGFVSAVTTHFSVDCSVHVTAVSAQQRYPWDGKVDITVSFAGASNDVVNAICEFAANNSATRAALDVVHITAIDGAVGGGTTWQRRFVWDAVTDVGGVKIEDVVLAVEVSLGGVQLWRGGPYWAEYNVGASKPEEYGYYFGWGDVVGYERNASNDGWASVANGVSFTFSSGNCPTYGRDNSSLLSQGYIDLTGNLVAACDAATVHLGRPWRIPTNAEFVELINNCTITWMTRNGVYGRLVTGKGAYLSKSVFFPAAGYGNDSRLDIPDSYGAYWSSTPHLDISDDAWGVTFNSGGIYRSFNGRCYGLTVRPLREFVSAAITHFPVDCSVHVTAVTAQQRYPWNGKVDITISFDGVSNDVANAMCIFVATNSATHTALNVAHITAIDGASATDSGMIWQRRFVWDAAADVGMVKIDDVMLTVGLSLGGVQLWENGPYWAECNVGATKPEEFGYYFWWGDTVGYMRNASDDGWVSAANGTSFSFSVGNSTTCGKDDSTLLSQGYIDSTCNLVAAYDAATAHLGRSWRIPTVAEFDALVSNCTTTWTMRNGVYGRLVTGVGAYESKSIFFPAAGLGYDLNFDNPAREGYYWLATSDSGNSYSAWSIYFDSTYFGRYVYSRDIERTDCPRFDYSRYIGRMVRPLRGLAEDSVATTHLALDCRADVLIEETLRNIGVVEFDEGTGWRITIVNEVVGGITLNDNLGPVTIDLNGHNMVGNVGVSGGDGTPAIRIVATGEDGEPTVLTILDSRPDSSDDIIGGAGGCGTPGGNGGAGIEVAQESRNGVKINIGKSVGVCGGAGGEELNGIYGGKGGTAVIGEIGTNDGTLTWGIAVESIRIIATPQNPCNGKVDVKFAINGIGGAKYEVSFTAKDVTGGTNITMRTIYKENGDAANVAREQLLLGNYNWVWDASSDLGEKTILTNVVVEGKISLGGVRLWKDGPIWAESNVGATKPEEFGYYFGWGDTVGYVRDGGDLSDTGYSDVTWVSSRGVRMTDSPFTESACPTFNKITDQHSSVGLLADGYIDATGNLVAAYDAATAHLGAPWRMPTDAEVLELVNNCTAEWITTNGVPGQLITGKGDYAMRSIFLPAAGYCGDTCIYFPGDCYWSPEGHYWTSTPYSGNDSFAWGLYVWLGAFCRNYTYYRCNGQSVRPVRVLAADGVTGASGAFEVGCPLAANFAGLGEVVPDGNGGWKVTLTNDVSEVIEIGDNLGPVTIDLVGRDIVGKPGMTGDGVNTAGGDGEPAIRVVSTGEDGEPTVLTIMDSQPDEMDDIFGGPGGGGTPGGNGGVGIEVALDAKPGVKVNIGSLVGVRGGAGGADLNGNTAGGTGGEGVVGDVGTNDGAISGGAGGVSENGTSGAVGVSVTGGIGGGSGTVAKVELMTPVLTPKSYTGAALSADVDAGTLFSVVGTGNWTDVGDHEIIFILKDPARYAWKGSDELFTMAVFSIVPATLTDEMIDQIPEQNYFGSAVEPEVVVRWNGKPLVRNGDYTITYCDNTGVGEGRVILTGIGNFTGTVERRFAIGRNDGVATFVGETVAVAEGGKLLVRVQGGNLDLASSVQVQATYNTAAAADLDLKNATVNGEKPKSFKFPVTLNWAAGEVGEKTIEIPVLVDKAVEADEMLTLQLVNPMNLTIAGSDGEGAVVTQGSACTVTIRDPGYGDLKAKVAAGSATKAEADALAKADKVFAGKAYVRGLANDATRGKVTGSALAADGKNVTLKATANKGWVFAGWYTDAACTAGHELAGFGDYRNPSLVYVNTNGAVTVYARFITPEEDSLALGEDFLPGEFAPGADCSIAVPVESVSYPTVKVTGLPAGMKFADKETLVKATTTTDAYTVEANTIYGAPTKAAAKPAVVTVTVKNLGGYQIVRQYEITVKEGMSPVETRARAVSEAAPYQSVSVGLSDDFAGKATGAGVFQAGKKVTLKTTANKGFVFSGWYEGEDLLTQAASYAFTMPSNDVSYVARFVTAEEDAASIATGVNGVALDPAAAFATNVMAGVALQWSVAADALSQTTVAVSGLPAGLKFTAKDVVDSKTKRVTVPANTVYGAPTAASKVDKSGNVTPSAVKVTVTTAGKSKAEYRVGLTVDPLPAWAVGTFNGGTLEEFGSPFPAPMCMDIVGTASFTVSSSGKVSGKATEGTAAWTLSAPSFTAYDAANGRLVAEVVGKSGSNAFTNELFFAEGALGGVATNRYFEAFQGNWKAEPWKTLGNGLANKVFDLGDGVTLKFAASGAVSVSAVFGSYKGSASSVLVPTSEPDGEGTFDGIVCVYLKPDPKKGFAGYGRVVRVRWDGTKFVELPANAAP